MAEWITGKLGYIAIGLAAVVGLQVVGDRLRSSQDELEGARREWATISTSRAELVVQAAQVSADKLQKATLAAEVEADRRAGLARLSRQLRADRDRLQDEIRDSEAQAAGEVEKVAGYDDLRLSEEIAKDMVRAYPQQLQRAVSVQGELFQLDRASAETVAESFKEVLLLRFARAKMADQLDTAEREIANGVEGITSALIEVDAERAAKLALLDEVAARASLEESLRQQLDLTERQNGKLKSRLFLSGFKDWIIVGGLSAAGIATGRQEGYLFSAGVASFFGLRAIVIR